MKGVFICFQLMATRKLFGRRWGFLFSVCMLALAQGAAAAERAPDGVDQELRTVLARQGFTGKVESTLEQRLGRPLDPAKANLGRLLFFDEFVGLHGDNSCAGCHSPLNGFGDSRSMAIGVENNDFVGPRRAGPGRGISAGRPRWSTRRFIPS